MVKKWVIWALVVAWTPGAWATSTLDKIKARGWLSCGIHGDLLGFSYKDEKGQFHGMDVAICRAVAAAVLGDSAKVQFRPVSSAERFNALQAGEIDILSRNTTWTFARDTSLDLNFPVITYYDGQGFMTRRDRGIDSPKEMAGATVCVEDNSTSFDNAKEYFHQKGLTVEFKVFSNSNLAYEAYSQGNCTVYTSDISGLAAARATLPDKEKHGILSEVISKEPLGPVVRQDDPGWTKIVRWVVYIMLTAEELGVSSTNLDAMLKSEHDDIKRLLGTKDEFGKMLGLSSDWALQIIKQVGNYGEVYDRYLGQQTALDLERGVNMLWSKGGLHYSPPLR